MEVPPLLEKEKSLVSKTYNQLAGAAGIEPASTVPETAILSIRLLEHGKLYYTAFVLLSLSMLSRPLISLTVAACLVEVGL